MVSAYLTNRRLSRNGSARLSSTAKPIAVSRCAAASSTTSVRARRLRQKNATAWNASTHSPPNTQTWPWNSSRVRTLRYGFSFAMSAAVKSAAGLPSLVIVTREIAPTFGSVCRSLCAPLMNRNSSAAVERRSAGFANATPSAGSSACAPRTVFRLTTRPPTAASVASSARSRPTEARAMARIATREVAARSGSGRYRNSRRIRSASRCAAVV